MNQSTQWSSSMDHKWPMEHKAYPLAPNRTALEQGSTHAQHPQHEDWKHHPNGDFTTRTHWPTMIAVLLSLVLGAVGTGFGVAAYVKEETVHKKADDLPNPPKIHTCCSSSVDTSSYPRVVGSFHMSATGMMQSDAQTNPLYTISSYRLAAGAYDSSYDSTKEYDGADSATGSPSKCKSHGVSKSTNALPVSYYKKKSHHHKLLHDLGKGVEFVAKHVLHYAFPLAYDAVEIYGIYKEARDDIHDGKHDVAGAMKCLTSDVTDANGNVAKGTEYYAPIHYHYQCTTDGRLTATATSNPGPHYFYTSLDYGNAACKDDADESDVVEEGDQNDEDASD